MGTRVVSSKLPTAWWNRTGMCFGAYPPCADESVSPWSEVTTTIVDFAMPSVSSRSSSVAIAASSFAPSAM